MRKTRASQTAMGTAALRHYINMDTEQQKASTRKLACWTRCAWLVQRTRVIRKSLTGQ